MCTRVCAGVHTHACVFECLYVLKLVSVLVHCEVVLFSGGGGGGGNIFLGLKLLNILLLQVFF